MAYIGNTPAENYASFETETFTVSATASYTLSHAVANENEIRLVINGVVQQPGSGKAYTASGTTLTLSSATASGDSMYAVYLGRALQTVNPPNASVGSAQVADSLISGKTALGATPADTDELLISDAGTLKRVDYSYLKSANTPAFFAYNSAAITVSDATVTKARLNAEDYDTDSAFDISSNYRFTVPSGKAGKYLFNYGVEGRSTNNDIFVIEAFLYKNGSQIAVADVNNNTASVAAHRSINVNRSVSLDLSVGDYIEVYGYIDCTSPASGFPTFEGGATTKNTFLSGQKIIE